MVKRIFMITVHLSIIMLFPLISHSTPIYFDVGGDFIVIEQGVLTFDGIIVIESQPYSYYPYSLEEEGGHGFWDILFFDITLDGLHFYGNEGSIDIGYFEYINMNLLGSGDWTRLDAYECEYPGIPVTEDFLLRTEVHTISNVHTDVYDIYGGPFSLTRVQAPVPEPATMLLVGSGLLGLAGFRKKFKMISHNGRFL